MILVLRLYLNIASDQWELITTLGNVLGYLV
jgi:hypothetical protein